MDSSFDFEKFEFNIRNSSHFKNEIRNQYVLRHTYRQTDVRQKYSLIPPPSDILISTELLVGHYTLLTVTVFIVVGSRAVPVVYLAAYCDCVYCSRVSSCAGRVPGRLL